VHGLAPPWCAVAQGRARVTTTHARAPLDAHWVQCVRWHAYSTPRAGTSLLDLRSPCGQWPHHRGGGQSRTRHQQTHALVRNATTECDNRVLGAQPSSMVNLYSTSMQFSVEYRRFFVVCLYMTFLIRDKNTNTCKILTFRMSSPPSPARPIHYSLAGVCRIARTKVSYLSTNVGQHVCHADVLELASLAQWW
jgi:hypothetical protein